MPTYTLTVHLPGGHTLAVTDTDPVSLRAAAAQLDPADLAALLPAPTALPAPPVPPPVPVPPAVTPAAPVAPVAGGWPPAAAPTCPHGPRVHKTGTSARGPWAAWMCAAPKDTPGRCDPLWID